MSLVELETNISQIEKDVIRAGEALAEVWFDPDPKVKPMEGTVGGFKFKGFGATVVSPDLEYLDFIKFVPNGLRVGTYEGKGPVYKELAWISFDETGEVKTRVTDGEGEKVKKLLGDIKNTIVYERHKRKAA